MTWFVALVFVILTFGHLSEAKHVNKKHTSAVVVVGKVYCDTCFQDDSDNTGHFISGAIVAVECKHGTALDPVFRGEAATNERGEFRVQLPPSVSKHARTIKGCSVKLIKSGEPYCAIASAAASSSSPIHLKSRSRGTRVFSAGFFSFRPLNQPNICNQKPRSQKNPIPTKKDKVQDLSFPPPLKDPSTPGDLPPLPSLPIPNIPLPPLPNLPRLPPLPRLPALPAILPPIISSTRKTAALKEVAKENDRRVDTKEFFFPPNPFQPPPLIPNPFQPPPAPLIPNPFQPPPAPLFPNPFQPPPAPPAPFFPLPTVPGLTPSPPPPPPPIFPFPFPPFPFHPPRSPGTPPAS